MQQGWEAGRAEVSPHGADWHCWLGTTGTLEPSSQGQGLPAVRWRLRFLLPGSQEPTCAGGLGAVPRQLLVDVLSHGCALLVPVCALAVHGVIQLQRRVRNDLGNSQGERVDLRARK